MERKRRAAAETGVYLVVVAAIVVVANVIAYMGVSRRVDVTRNQRYTLSQGSGRLVRDLRGQMNLDAYVTRGLPKLDAFVRDLTELLRLYERASAGKLKFTIIEATSDQQRSEAKEAGLQDVAFGEGSETGEEKASIAQGYMGLVFKYKSEKDKIPLLSPDRSDGLEFWITNKIRDVRDRADDIHHKIGVVTGKDEIKLTETNLVASQGSSRGGPNIKAIFEQAFGKIYEFEDVDLKNGDTEIADHFVGLIVTQPGKDFTDKELRRIDEFLMKGNKSLAVFASAANMKAQDASMRASLSTHGLEKLLGGYGVELKKDAVFDWARSVRLPVITQTGGAAWIRAPSIVQVQHDPRFDEQHQMLDNSFPGFFRIDEISFPFPSTLVPHPDKQPGAAVKVIARTTPAAWSVTDDSVDMKISPTWKPRPPLDQRAIAVTVDGKLKSAMGSGDGVEVPAESRAPSRVLAVSSSQFLANPFARAGNGPDLGPQFAMFGPIGGDEQLLMISQPYAQKYLTATILAFKNTLDWMAGDSDLIAASAKILGEPNLTYADIARPKLEATDDETTIKKKDEEYRDARKRTQRNVQWTLTLVCPALFAAYGILRWRMREAARGKLVPGT